MAVVTPENVDAFEAIMDKWAVEYSWLGEVTGTGRLIIEWDGEKIVDVDPRTVAHEGPVYERPYHRPADLDTLHESAPDSRAVHLAMARAAASRAIAAGLLPIPALDELFDVLTSPPTGPK